MTLQDRVFAEISKAPGSARELAERTGLDEKQVRSAIDGLRAAKGTALIVNRPDGAFALGDSSAPSMAAKQKRITHPGEKSLEPFETAIGKMCREWAHLENTITVLFFRVAGWDYTLPMAYPMASCIDIRSQVNAIKLGILCWDQVDEIQDRLFDSLNYIDNELRNARNRFVHDILAPADDGTRARRINSKYLQKKEPGTGTRKLKDPFAVHVELVELTELTSDIEAEQTYIFKLDLWLRNPRENPGSDPLLEPPQRLHLHRQMEMQRRMLQDAAKQKPPPKSSRA